MEVIDSRFLADYFLSDDEEIKSKATKHLTDLIKKRKGILPTIAITEIVRYVCNKRGAEEGTIRYLSLVRSGLFVSELTGEIAREAGLLKCLHPSIPTGDCIVACTAREKKAKVLSDDEHFDEIKGISRVWL